MHNIYTTVLRFNRNTVHILYLYGMMYHLIAYIIYVNLEKTKITLSKCKHWYSNDICFVNMFYICSWCNFLVFMGDFLRLSNSYKSVIFRLIIVTVVLYCVILGVCFTFVVFILQYSVIHLHNGLSLCYWHLHHWEKDLAVQQTWMCIFLLEK